LLLPFSILIIDHSSSSRIDAAFQEFWSADSAAQAGR
jgi:hypothetical protein